MLTLTQRQVLPAANDATTFYVAMQPSQAGQSVAEYVSPLITFVPQSQALSTGGSLQVQGAVTSNTQYNFPDGTQIVGTSNSTSSISTNTLATSNAVNQSVATALAFSIALG